MNPNLVLKAVAAATKRVAAVTAAAAGEAAAGTAGAAVEAAAAVTAAAVVEEAVAAATAVAVVEVVAAEEAAEMAVAVDIIKIINLPAGRQVLANYILNPFQLERIFYYTSPSFPLLQRGRLNIFFLFRYCILLIIFKIIIKVLIREACILLISIFAKI